MTTLCKILREKAGLTYKDLAAKSGVSAWRIQRWDRFKGRPSGRACIRIAQVLHCQPERLFDVVITDEDLKTWERFKASLESEVASRSGNRENDMPSGPLWLPWTLVPLLILTSACIFCFFMLARY